MRRKMVVLKVFCSYWVRKGALSESPFWRVKLSFGRIVQLPRHTVATLLLRNGVDIRVVQEFLGHASIATTQSYTHVTKDHLVQVLRERHPSLAIRRRRDQ